MCYIKRTVTTQIEKMYATQDVLLTLFYVTCRNVYSTLIFFFILRRDII